MKNWVYKSAYVIKCTLSSYRKVLIAIFSMLGVLLTINEAVQIFWQKEFVQQFIRLYPWQILIVCLVFAFISVKQPLKKTICIQSTDIKITLKVGNILRGDDAIVIPTNTTFDTLMEDEFISGKSIQGQFQEHYFKNNLSTLDNLIERGLEGIQYEDLQRQKSKNKRYPIGTVSKITQGRKHIYFLAVADINEYGKPEGISFGKIQEALEGLWQSLNSKGHVENIAMPIIGTGRAGLNEPREKVIREIIFSFVACCKSTKLTENLCICIHPTDLREASFELETLYEYLDYMCRFGSMNSNQHNEGIGIR